jgi:hypothetical protein
MGPWGQFIGEESNWLDFPPWKREFSNRDFPNRPTEHGAKGSPCRIFRRLEGSPDKIASGLEVGAAFGVNDEKF